MGGVCKYVYVYFSWICTRWSKFEIKSDGKTPWKISDIFYSVQSARVKEYTDCISAEGHPTKNLLNMTLNSQNVGFR